MENQIMTLRKKYERFRNGEEDALEVMNDARLVLEEAKKKGHRKVADEVEDMLLDLEFSLEENKCKCHRKHTNYQT